MPLASRSRKPASKQNRRTAWWLSPLSLGIAVIILGAAVAFLLARVPNSPTYDGQFENITTGVIGEYGALMHIAQEQGFFTKHGLRVELKEYSAGPPALADLLSGKLDTAMAADFAGVRNSFGGEDLKILANTSKSTVFSLLIRSDRQINNVSDLRGKKIGITRKTAGEFYLGQYLTFNKLSFSDVIIFDQPPEQLTQSLIRGELDAAVFFEPNTYKTLATLEPGAKSWPIQSSFDLNSLLYGSGQLTRDRPLVIERYLKALIEAEQFIKNHDREARQILVRRLQYSSEYIDYVWPKFNFKVSLDQDLLLNMEDQARWAIENKLTDATEVPNYLRLIHLPGLSAVRPEAVTIIH